MSVLGLNHVVLYVRDAQRSEAFYRDVLEFRTVKGDSKGRFCFMVAPGSGNDHDLALFTVGASSEPSEAGRGRVGMYHVAWEVPTLAELVRFRSRLADAAALVGESDHGISKSLYAHDPDGLEFEVMWAVPVDRLDGVIVGTAPLDIDAELARYGADTLGGRLAAVSSARAGATNR